ncbi:interferon-induced GTP-binding protein Mx2-like [Elephas maximus indicus]|uniref:interferon-induced GTP-binding protein Mx2-like n=1 Tax=Elephas maximus indicus TaxID=99487 RepID=UPI0021164DD6|nr:interferon-induced GTP-binding protein Mx2-like [Elephas maximus indicus]XP_049730861.1 interferon-induced GTP-binding protein Mx2-like [Elephas maximus indicus]
MPKVHKPCPQQNQNPLSSQYHPEKEMSSRQRPPPSFRPAQKQIMSPPNQQAGDVTMHFTSLMLNEQTTSMPPGENRSQPPLAENRRQPPPGENRSQLPPGENRSQPPPGENMRQPPPGENRSQPRAKWTKSILHSQYEEKVRPYIDLIDFLWTLGVDQDLALPAIAVIGDQSSGKSSVLEALSGVALPRGTSITTRCPLVLKLKRQPCEYEWRGKLSYRDKELHLHSPEEVEQVIHKAQNAIAGHGVSISHEPIHLEITSPEVPDLTLIDLPGIARVAMGNQPQDIGLQIKSFIKKYIERQETINLVVMPCNVDIATTEALNMAKEVDPDGDRTIGILTKPDLVDKGLETGILNVVRNLTYHLKKGYMIVRCRGQQEITDKLSLAEATKREIDFFQTHRNFRVLLEEGRATVPCLAERLTTELIVHIKKSLPLLGQQIQESHQRATEELRHYGTEVPDKETDKMFFLIEKVKVFNRDVEKLVEGEEAVKENETRLYNKIRMEFKTWNHVLAANTQKVKNIVHEEVSKYENQYRGKELPGFINYQTFVAIVRQYIQQLVDPALNMLQKVTDIVQQAFIAQAKTNFREFPNLNQTAQDLIEKIKMRQAEAAENLVQLQFSMEQLVFCQDELYCAILKEVRKQTSNPLENNPQLFQRNQLNIFGASVMDPSTSSITEIGVHLNAYFTETSRRLANQIPLIIQFFLLQENSDCLQRSMMHILHEKEGFAWLLQEQTETAAKRRFLKERIYRLTQARCTLRQFST